MTGCCNGVTLREIAHISAASMGVKRDSIVLIVSTALGKVTFDVSAWVERMFHTQARAFALRVAKAEGAQCESRITLGRTFIDGQVLRGADTRSEHLEIMGRE